MKKTIILPFVLLSALFITSCGKTPINGDLDGMWHLRSIETLADNTVEDVKEKRIYYAIQLKLITLRQIDGDVPQYVGRFNHTGDSLILRDFRVYLQEDKEATAEDLETFGLHGTTSRFGVKALNSKKMILRSEDSELTFKKF